MLTLYIHIPYCIVKCGYCDFHSLPTARDEVPHQSYTQIVIDQLRHAVERYYLAGRDIGAVFFGGGTPSLMKPVFFEHVVKELNSLFRFACDIEITSEMNPATAKLDWMREVRRSGVNRLSIGIQSFQRKFLAFLDRDHTVDDVRHVMLDAHEAGFENINCDLIYAIPGQQIDEAVSDVQQAISFEPHHISAYQLTFERGTPLFRNYEYGVPKGMPPKLDEEHSLEQMRQITQLLEENGYARYEISNYARTGFESKHNLNYWRYGEYLGLGSGAVSFLQSPLTPSLLFNDGAPADGKRWTTTRNVERYLCGDFEEKDIDVVDTKTAMAEFCFLGLRTREGVSNDAFQRRFGISLEERYASVVKQLLQEKLLSFLEGKIALTPRGIEVSDEVFRRFL